MSPKVTEEHKEQRRNEIIVSAIEVFKSKGYVATTMQDVMEESGISRGGVYLYFSNKEDLFLSLLDYIGQLQSSQFEEVSKNRTAWEAINAWLQVEQNEALHAHDSIVPAIIEFSTTVWREAPKRESLLGRYYVNLEGFTTLLQKGVNDGEFQPILPLETITKFVLTFVDGLFISEVFLRGKEADLRIAAQMDSLRFYLRHALQVKNDN